MLKSPLPRRARRIAGAAVVAAVVAGAGLTAWAAQPGAGTTQGLITQPVWLEKPSAQDVAELLPKTYEPARGHVSGYGTMTCRVGADGRLSPCNVDDFVVTSDQVVLRKGYKAVDIWTAPMLALSQRFRMAPVSRDGAPTAGKTVRIPVRWAPAGQRDADVAANATPTIAKPDWVERPTGADFAQFYPASAEAGGWNADVLLTCRVGAQGSLTSCAVTRSTVRRAGEAGGPYPQEIAMDFGTASLEIAKLFRMTPSASGGVVRIPIRWLLAPKA